MASSDDAAAVLLLNTRRSHYTRDQVCAVQLQFQGFRVTLPDYGTVPNVGSFINSLPLASRQIVRAQERQTGTHCLRQLSYAYTEPDYTYPIPGADFTDRLVEFRGRLNEDLSEGLIPVVELAGDGQTYDPNGGTYGFPWLQAHLERILDALGGTADDCLFFHCWEAVNNGGWSPDNLFEMTRLHRRLRPQHHLAWHFSYAWPGDAQGASGGPIVEWSTDGQDCDVMLAEGDAPFLEQIDGQWTPLRVPDPRTGQLVLSDAVNGWQQRARCFLGPKANSAIIDPSNLEPFYWITDPQTPRGPRFAVAFELDEYRDDRGQVSLEEIQAERDYCRALGFTSVC